MSTPIVSRIPILVRYAETDRMGIVHHARFLEYLEMGRVDLMKQTGVSYRDLEARGIRYPVLEVWVRYRRSITFDDEIVLESWYRELTRTRVTFGYALKFPDGERIAEALTLHGQTDPAGRPTGIDPEVTERVTPHLVLRDPAPGRLRLPEKRTFRANTEDTEITEPHGGEQRASVRSRGSTPTG
jgi:acyl-CoA thioester hydrolase